MAREPDRSVAGGRTLGMSRRQGERWGQFAARVGNAFGLVLLLVIATYALGSLTPFRAWSGALITFVASGAGVIALASAGVRPRTVRVAGGFALIAVALAALAAILDDPHLLGASGLIMAALLLLAAASVLREVVGETEVGFRTILGAISVYMILGLLFTFLYVALDHIQTTPFFGTTVGKGDTLFFSFTTLTNTGYGNLVPAGQPGKMFAGLEMLTGQIFLVTLVAGLVSLWRPSAIARRRRQTG